MKSLGIDIGSSSIKVSLLDIPTGECVASATNPAAEIPIEALRSGWAEQDPKCGGTTSAKASGRSP